MKERLVKYLLVLVAALVASACIKVDQERQAISFIPVTEPATKTIIDGENYPQDGVFVVSAYYDDTNRSIPTTTYFTNAEARRISSSGLWKTDTDYFWPLEGTLIFNAYSPSGVSGVSIGQSGFTATDYTIGNDPEQMSTDLCFATYREEDCSNRSFSSVPLEFSHALSQVVFVVRAKEYSSSYDIYLTSLSFGEVYSKGNFTVSSGWSVNTPISYTLWNTPLQMTFDGDNNPVSREVCKFLFLPQNLDAATLTVGYRIDKNQVTQNSPTVSVDLSGLSGAITEWERAKKYIYTIDIGLDNNLTLTMSVEPWILSTPLSEML